MQPRVLGSSSALNGEMSAWHKLRSGNTEEALADMITQHRRDPTNPSTAIQVGVAFMWLGRWEFASTHFRQFMERSTCSTDILPKFAGTAMWCAGQRESALEEWKRGQEADYTDAAGGVTIPLHLYFAAVACPALLNTSEAELLVHRALARPGMEYPAVLARVALGGLGKAQAVQIAAASDPNGTQRHPWKLAFWQGVHFLASGRKQDFLREMDLVASVSWVDFDEDESAFIDRLWSSEFFLARHHRGGQ